VQIWKGSFAERNSSDQSLACLPFAETLYGALPSLNGIRLPGMRPRAILIAALLLVVLVAAIIVGWAKVGDRPGPLNTRAFSHAQGMGAGTSS
jgi:hypothetical protein